MAQKFFQFYLPVLFWMGIIFVLSSRTRISVSDTYALNFLFFKTLHVAEYAALFLLIRRALRYGAKKRETESNQYALIITLLYAVSDELHQQFVPSRQGHIRDVIIDGIGALFAWISLIQLPPHLPKKLKSWVRALQII